MDLSNVTVNGNGVLGNLKYIVGEFTLPKRYLLGGMSGLDGETLGLGIIEHVSFQTPSNVSWDKGSSRLLMYTNKGAEVADNAPIHPNGPFTFLAIGV